MGKYHMCIAFTTIAIYCCIELGHLAMLYFNTYENNSTDNISVMSQNY